MRAVPARRPLTSERVAHALHGQANLVGVDWTDGTPAGRAFLRQYHLTYPNLIDADGTAGQDYGLNGLPTTFILDAQGKITEVLRGPQTADTLLRALHLTAGDRFLGNYHRALKGLPAFAWQGVRTAVPGRRCRGERTKPKGGARKCRLQQL